IEIEAPPSNSRASGPLANFEQATIGSRAAAALAGASPPRGEPQGNASFSADNKVCPVGFENPIVHPGRIGRIDDKASAVTNHGGTHIREGNRSIAECGQPSISVLKGPFLD